MSLKSKHIHTLAPCLASRACPLHANCNHCDRKPKTILLLPSIFLPTHPQVASAGLSPTGFSLLFKLHLSLSFLTFKSIMGGKGACCSVGVRVRGQPRGVGPLLPPLRWVWGLNSCHQACRAGALTSSLSPGSGLVPLFKNFLNSVLCMCRGPRKPDGLLEITPQDAGNRT